MLRIIIRKSIFSCFLLLAIPFMAKAETLKTHLLISSDSVHKNEVIDLTYIVNSSDTIVDFQLNDYKDWIEVFKIKLYSRRILSTRKGPVYIYRYKLSLRAKLPGELIVPGAEVFTVNDSAIIGAKSVKVMRKRITANALIDEMNEDRVKTFSNNQFDRIESQRPLNKLKIDVLMNDYIVRSGETFMIEYYINDLHATEILPSLLPFSIASGPTRELKNSIVNDIQVQVSVIRYYIKAHDPGEYTIPPARVIKDGYIVDSPSINVFVKGD